MEAVVVKCSMFCFCDVDLAPKVRHDIMYVAFILIGSKVQFLLIHVHEWETSDFQKFNAFYILLTGRKRV